AEDGIRDRNVTGVQTCALPILRMNPSSTLKTSILTSSIETERQTAYGLMKESTPSFLIFCINTEMNTLRPFTEFLLKRQKKSRKNILRRERPTRPLNSSVSKLTFIYLQTS